PDRAGPARGRRQPSYAGPARRGAARPGLDRRGDPGQGRGPARRRRHRPLARQTGQVATDDTELAGINVSHLDQPGIDGARATNGDLVAYLDAVHERLLPELRDRALSVVRARLGQAPFMQKNLPKYAPDWIRTTTVWAAASKRDVSYPVCDDRRTLVW